MDETIRRQYEACPYPPRDPADEAKRLITGSPSHLAELNHFLFAGRRDFARPFRVLVAGGGTGDATVMLAQQLADARADAEIVCLDIARSSLAIAEARIRTRGLGNVRLVRGSLLDLPTLGLGRFDYVDCCGVLHHLDDPQAGLAALAGALQDDGGMGLMVYAPLGRTGVYPAQGMLRLLGGDAPDAVRIDLARRLVAALPPTNWLKRNPFVADHLGLGDAGLYDLLLHARDRAYTVPEAVELAASAGLRVVTFIDPVRYEPLLYLRDPQIARRIEGLSGVARAALAELAAGNMKTHVFYVVKAANRAETVAVADAPDAVPVLRDLDGRTVAAELTAGDRALVVEIHGLKHRFRLPDLAAAILARIDGRRTLREIHSAIASGGKDDPDWPAFLAAYRELFRTLNGLSRLYVRFPR
jgi:SAM-dependent methyltransferase